MIRVAIAVLFVGLAAAGGRVVQAPTGAAPGTVLSLEWLGDGAGSTPARFRISSPYGVTDDRLADLLGPTARVEHVRVATFGYDAVFSIPPDHQAPDRALREARRRAVESLERALDAVHRDCRSYLRGLHYEAFVRDPTGFHLVERTITRQRWLERSLELLRSGGGVVRGVQAISPGPPARDLPGSPTVHERWAIRPAGIVPLGGLGPRPAAHALEDRPSVNPALPEAAWRELVQCAGPG